MPHVFLFPYRKHTCIACLFLNFSLEDFFKYTNGSFRKGNRVLCKEINLRSSFSSNDVQDTSLERAIQSLDEQENQFSSNRSSLELSSLLFAIRIDFYEIHFLNANRVFFFLFGRKKIPNFHATPPFYSSCHCSTFGTWDDQERAWRRVCSVLIRRRGWIGGTIVVVFFRHVFFFDGYVCLLRYFLRITRGET